MGSLLPCESRLRCRSMYGRCLPQVSLNSSGTVPEEVAKGSVLVKSVVTSRGDVASVEILHGAGNGFDENAMALVVMSRFKPATIAGIPVRTEVTLRLTFHSSLDRMLYNHKI